MQQWSDTIIHWTVLDFVDAKHGISSKEEKMEVHGMQRHLIRHAVKVKIENTMIVPSNCRVSSMTLTKNRTIIIVSTNIYCK